MRWLCLALLLWPSAALGWGTRTMPYQPFTLTHADSTRLHVALVEDDWARRMDPTNTNTAQLSRAAHFNMILAALYRQGIEVHTYTWSYFEGQPQRWRDLGRPRSGGGGGYAVALMPYWLGSTTTPAAAYRYAPTLRRYFRADSTSAQLVHFGGAGYLWRDNDTAHADSMVGVYGNVLVTVDAASSAAEYVRMTRVAANGDTMFIGRTYSQRMSPSPSSPNTARIVRPFLPTYRAASDTLVTAFNDTTWWGWRVVCTNQGQALAASPEAWFISASGNENTPSHTTVLLWAVLSRYVNTKPFKLVFSMNDYAQFGYNPRFPSRPDNYTPTTNTANQRWPTGGHLDSVFAEMRDKYGVKVIVMGSQPDSAKWLWATFPQYDPNRRHPHILWGDHWHTKDSLSLSRNPFSNTTSNIDSTATTLAYRMVANRRDPANPVTALRYGVRQLLDYTDSLWSTLGVKHSGFMLPANDRLMLIGARDYAGTVVCPAESLFEVLAATGHNYIADVTNVYSATAALRSASAQVRGNSGGNSNPRWPLFPQDIYITKTGKRVYWSSYEWFAGSAPSTAGSPGTGGPYQPHEVADIANKTLARLMGFVAGRAGNMSHPAYLYGQTSTASAAPRFTDHGRPRVFGFHYPGGYMPWGWATEYRTLEAALLKPIQTFERIAGRQLIEWTTPEDAYGAKY